LPTIAKSGTLWYISTLIDRKLTSQFPSVASYETFSQMFATFFSDEIVVFLYSLMTSYTTVTHSYQSQRFFSLKKKCEKSSLIKTFCELELIHISWGFLNSLGFWRIIYFRYGFNVSGIPSQMMDIAMVNIA